MGMYDKLLQEDRKPLQKSAPRIETTPTPPIPALMPEVKPSDLETYEPRNLAKKELRNVETYKLTNLETKEPRKKALQTQKKPTKQYNTSLTTESILATKRLAVDENKKDYEVVQEALDQYLKKKGYLET
jgi:hypothetical protein